MQAVAHRHEFAPPATPGLLRALALAVLAHAFLLAALTWGVQWKHQAQVASFEAELWSSLPIEAAPPPPIETLQPVEPEPIVPKLAPPDVEPEPLPPSAKVDIALAREKERQKKLEQAQLDKQRLERLREEKLQETKRRQAQLKLKEAQDKKEADKAARQLEEQRSRNLARMAGMAGATGAAEANGTAPRSSGPSASYAGRIRARIKPNIVFTRDIAGNPTAEVEVRTSPDGTIVGRKLLQSSGVAAWDEAVLQAIDKTEVLPRDIDGRVPPLLEISFRPKD